MRAKFTIKVDQTFIDFALGEALAAGESYDLAERGKVVENGVLVHPYIREHLEMKAHRAGEAASGSSPG